MSKTKCPICNSKADIGYYIEGRDRHFCRCNSCGEYYITEPTYKDFTKPEKHKDVRYILSRCIRKAFNEGKTLEISLANYQKIINSTVLP